MVLLIQDEMRVGMILRYLNDSAKHYYSLGVDYSVLWN